MRAVRLFLLTVALLTLTVAAAHRYWPWKAVHFQPGQLVAPADPQQQAGPPRSLGTVAGYELTSLAKYTVTARLLSSRRYRHEAAYELVPIDLALGWGRMSDDAVLDRLEISQGFRFYFYTWRGAPPIPPTEMATHSANTHVIPATPEIASTLCWLPRGAVVKLTGDLVKARNAEGREWTSSLTRDDAGPGACELMYVRSAERVAVATPGQ